MVGDVEFPEDGEKSFQMGDAQGEEFWEVGRKSARERRMEAVQRLYHKMIFQGKI